MNMKPQKSLPLELYQDIRENGSTEMKKGLSKLCNWLKVIDKKIISGKWNGNYMILTLDNHSVIQLNAFGDLFKLPEKTPLNSYDLKALYGIRTKEKLSREWGLN